MGSDVGESPIATSIMKAANHVSDRAPGSGRRIRFANYDEAKIIATKRYLPTLPLLQGRYDVDVLAEMQQYPSGTRYPSSVFSGFGFSKTLNDGKLRAAGLGSGGGGVVDQTTTAAGLDSLCGDEAGSGTDTAETEEVESPPAARAPFAETAYFDPSFGRLGGVAEFSAEVEAALGATASVPEILAHLHLAKYVQAFAEEEIDLDTFLALDEADLRSLGVATIGARRKLITAQKGTPLPSPPCSPLTHCPLVPCSAQADAPDPLSGRTERIRTRLFQSPERLTSPAQIDGLASPFLLPLLHPFFASHVCACSRVY